MIWAPPTPVQISLVFSLWALSLPRCLCYEPSRTTPLNTDSRKSIKGVYPKEWITIRAPLHKCFFNPQAPLWIHKCLFILCALVPCTSTSSFHEGIAWWQSTKGRRFLEEITWRQWMKDLQWDNPQRNYMNAFHNGRIQERITWMLSTMGSNKGIPRRFYTNGIHEGIPQIELQRDYM